MPTWLGEVISGRRPTSGLPPHLRIQYFLQGKVVYSINMEKSGCNDRCTEPESQVPSPIDILGLETPTSVNEAKLLRRIDYRVLPMLGVVYFVTFLDRVNISNALTMGLPEELGLSGDQPNIALTIFFIPYMLFEIPSNLCMKRFSPHLWLSLCTVSFGIVMLGQGFVHNFGGLLATRFFLGMAEAGIFPGSFYLISFWYRRDESLKRFTAFWSSILLAGSFGGLLATAISNMDGICGLRSWRWLFILEGILTIVVGIVAFFALTDFPREAKWLSPDERAWVIARTQNDESCSVPISLNDIVTFFRDIKVYVAAVVYFAMVIPVYSFSYFAPTIIQQTLDYSILQTQLHTVPPFAAAFGLCIVTAYWSDRTQIRLPYVLAGEAILLVGLALVLNFHGKSNFSIQYAGICLIAMGSFAASICIVCWVLMNLRGHLQRSLGSGWIIGFGNAGGIAATFAFIKTDAPKYVKGYWTLISMSIVCIVGSVIYAVLVHRERKAARAKVDRSRMELSL